MKNLIILILLFTGLSAIAQIDFTKHQELLLNAHRAKSNNELEKALHLYEEAFHIHDDNTIAEYINAALVAAKLNNEKSCLKWIEQAIVVQKAEQKFIREFSTLELYQKSANSVLLRYDDLLKQHYQRIENYAIYSQVQALVNRDQFTRKLQEYHLQISEEEQQEAYEGFIKSQAAKDSVARKKYQAILWPKVDEKIQDHQWRVMRYTDSLNIVKLMEITKKHGWQSQADILLWHQRGSYVQENWVWNYFKPLIDQEIKLGRIAPFFWAKYEDISSIRKTGKSIYGYHPGRVDPKTVNIKRKEIGLPLLTEDEIAHRNKNPRGGRVF